MKISTFADVRMKNYFNVSVTITKKKLARFRIESYVVWHAGDDPILSELDLGSVGVHVLRGGHQSSTQALRMTDASWT